MVCGTKQSGLLTATVWVAGEPTVKSLEFVLGLQTHLEVGMPSTTLTDPEAQLRHCEISVQRPNDPPVQGVTVHQKLHLSATHGYRNLVPCAVGQAKRERLHLCCRLMLCLIMKTDLVFTAARLQLQVPVKEKVSFFMFMVPCIIIYSMK